MSGIDEVNRAMDSLMVAAGGVITAWSDTVVRGYFKEHPAEVLYRAELLEKMIAAVRDAAAGELGKWPAYGGDPADAHAAETEEFTQHLCNCEHCWHAAADPETGLVTADRLERLMCWSGIAQRPPHAVAALAERINQLAAGQAMGTP